ncbi:WXG100 family type VII secretion target [Streptomyces sp. DSM 42041]|uniref:WXG100 family type VII secretion target n=1 Tax=Streptomyces hazeniae TaxID=3075538 RepID=A0ABU2NTY9_9ACTN|nr:WXG100 family type VII secretion target [Streptomyces sp. DSM 42041]MDT0380224.1 WXG100 family type VII secretion target [Streptomyces sp. DSM 42041]
MDLLGKLGISISGPFSDVLDEAVRGIIAQFGLEDDLEKVSGDNERLMEVAGDYREAARDLRGVVDDLKFERKRLNGKWAGEAADAFHDQMGAYEDALSGEADDMDQIADLLQLAAEACAEAEQLMIDLIVEIVQAVIAAAATTAVLSFLTAGAAAVIGPLITAAGVAHKAMKAVRITAKLADTLSDLAKRMQALRKMAKLRRTLRAFNDKKNPMSHRNALKRYRGKFDDIEGGSMSDLRDAGAYWLAKRTVKKEVVYPLLGVETGDVIKEGYATYGPEGAPGVASKQPLPQDESSRFEDRMNDGLSPKQKVENDFG